MEINYFPKRKQIQTEEQSFAINPTVIPINGWCLDGGRWSARQYSRESFWTRYMHQGKAEMVSSGEMRVRQTV